MAAKNQRYDSFRRGERRQGGKHGTYTKNVSRNAAKKGKAALNRTVLDLIFCALLPPYGVYRVWTEDKNAPLMKIGCTALAMLILFLWFLLIIPENKPDPVEVTPVRATQSVG